MLYNGGTDTLTLIAWWWPHQKALEMPLQQRHGHNVIQHQLIICSSLSINSSNQSPGANCWAWWGGSQRGRCKAPAGLCQAPRPDEPQRPTRAGADVTNGDLPLCRRVVAMRSSLVSLWLHLTTMIQGPQQSAISWQHLMDATNFHLKNKQIQIVCLTFHAKMLNRDFGETL